MSLDYATKKYPEETHTDTGRTFKPQRERPRGSNPSYCEVRGLITAAQNAQAHLFNAAELTRQKIKLTCILLCRETHLGKASKQYVFLVSGKATLMPEVRGEWRTTAAHSNRDAKSTVGTVPILCPYRMIFSGLMPYLGQHTVFNDAFQNTYPFYFLNDWSIIGPMCSVMLIKDKV